MALGPVGAPGEVAEDGYELSRNKGTGSCRRVWLPRGGSITRRPHPPFPERRAVEGSHSARPAGATPCPTRSLAAGPFMNSPG